MAKVGKVTKPSSHQAIEKIRSWLENNGALVGIALIVLLISLSLFLPKDRFQQAKERLIRNPNDLQAHLILAEEYLKNNQLSEAEKELLWAQQIQQSGYQPAKQPKKGTLGATTSTLEELWQKKREADPEDIKELIEYWEKIVTEKPNFRDGYLQLALLHYKLYKDEKAKEYLGKALELDPNFEPAREMEEILGD